MSLHPSLRGSSHMKRHRSVLSRLERLKALMKKGSWADTMSPLGLPKVKNLKITIKKEKAATPAAGETAAAGTAAPAAPASAGKPAAGAAPGAPAKKPDTAAKPKKE